MLSATLPKIQNQCTHESERQASQAVHLEASLRKARERAEQLAGREMERTQELQEQILASHPQISVIKHQLSEFEKAKEERDQKRLDEIQKLEVELSEKQKLMGGFDDMEKRKEQHASELHENEEDLGKLNRDISKLETDMQNTERNLVFMGRKVDDVSNELMVQQSHLVASKRIRETDVSPLLSEAKMLERDLFGLQEGLPDLEKECQVHSFQSSELEDKVHAAQQLYLQTNALCNDQFTQLDSLRSRLEILAQDKDNADRRSKDSERAQRSLERGIEITELQLDRTGKDLREITDRERSIELEIQRLRNEQQRCAARAQELLKKSEELTSKAQQGHSELQTAQETARNDKTVLRTVAGEIERQVKAIEEQNQLNEATVAKRREAEAEIVKGRALKDQVQEQLRMSNDAVRATRDKIALISNQLNATLAKIKAIDKEKQGPPNYEQIECTIEGLKMAQTDFERQRSSFREELARLEKAKSALEAQKGALKTNRQSLKKRMEEIDEQLSSTTVPGSLRYIQQRIKEIVEETKRDSHKLRQMQDRLSNETAALKESWLDNVKDVPELHAQLQREAEAVMRAEAAIALEKQQSKIRQESAEMASVKISESPSIYVDEEATNVIYDDLT